MYSRWLFRSDFRVKFAIKGPLEKGAAYIFRISNTDRKQNQKCSVDFFSTSRHLARQLSALKQKVLAIL